MAVAIVSPPYVVAMVAPAVVVQIRTRESNLEIQIQNPAAFPVYLLIQIDDRARYRTKDTPPRSTR